MFDRLWKWIKSFWTEYYQVTIWFDGATVTNPDGSTTTSRDPKTFECKKIVKITDTHIKLIEKDGSQVEIKTVNPVGYDVKKPKNPPLD